MEILIEKSKRLLSLMDDGRSVFQCPAGLGSQPVGAKERSGDGKTPEGTFYICLVKEQGKYGRSLGLSYPDEAAARKACAKGIIDQAAMAAIADAHGRRVRPPWGTTMGGEIYIHEGGAARDWTAGCIALDAEAMDVVFPVWQRVERVLICP